VAIEDPLWLQGLDYEARLDRQVIELLGTEGIVTPTSFLVAPRSAGANMSVDVSAGRAIIQGDDETNQGRYLVRSTAVENVTLSAAPGSNSRIDAIILRVNDPNAGGGAGDNGVVAKVDGTPAASPSVPTIPSTAILLATVLVPSGKASIVAGDITDVRPLSSACPIGRGFDWFGPDTMVPNGAVAGDGRAVSRTTYADGFALYGTSYGAGDGSTTFNVPDLRGRTTFGRDNMGTAAGITGDSTRTIGSTRGATAGAKSKTMAISEMPSHQHGSATAVESATHVHAVGAGGVEFTLNSLGLTNLNPFVNAGGVGTHTISVTPGTGNIATASDSTAFNTGGQSVNHVHGIPAEGGGAAFSILPPHMLVTKCVILAA
jgi:microcystin-dependent protein